ncbi:SCO0607 family lipoprotein [Streptomyces tendae]
MRTTHLSHRPSGVSATRAGRSLRGLVLACAAASAVLTGCSMEEASCGGGEYPVMTIGDTGSACVPNGDEPPKGYTRYPEGKVPEHVGDEWDTYWQTHTVDERGKVVEVPAGG